ncbi:hypothetical protein BC629DRAFT_689880 [Irpex lacteus]|nr:hypothetical protein BC629DRAFT_689880 [Irpex lacteus]
MPTMFDDFKAGKTLLYLHSQLEALLRLCWHFLTDLTDGVHADLREFIPSFNTSIAQDFLPHAFTAEDNALLTLALLFLLTGLILIYVLIPCVWNFRRAHSQAYNAQQYRLPLQALITVITPTESRWPAYYHNITRRNSSARDPYIQLSLNRLWDDLLSGTVELLRPELSLPDLITDQLYAYGWRFRLIVDCGWMLGCMLRVLAARLACVLPQWNTILRPTLKPVPQLDSPNANYKPALSLDRSVLMLDDVPYRSLTAYIRTFQRSLLPGTSAIVGFSALGTSSLTSSQFVMAALPFLPRKYIRATTSKSYETIPQSARRTLTPVLTSLESVLRMLSSGPDALIVDSVQNVSDSYTGYLYDYVDELVKRSSTRDRFVTQWGMEGWREEVLTGQWEAALFSAQMLKRWLVVVRK